MNPPTVLRFLTLLCLGWLLAGTRLSAGLVSHDVSGTGSSPASAAPASAPAPHATPAPAPVTPALAAPAANDTFSFAPSYTFTTTDALTVSVYGEDDLSTQTRVDTTGCINLNLVGKVKIAGLTISEAQKAIEKAYQDQRYLRNPQVTINIQTVATREVSIQGQVKAPGRYPLPIETSLSVVDLVTKAGGFTDIAAGTRVTITHFDSEGKPHVITVDVDKIIKGKDKSGINDQSLMLQPGDIVFVPETFI
jgi:polysaccharide export outer membrane protein